MRRFVIGSREGVQWSGGLVMVDAPEKPLQFESVAAASAHLGQAPVWRDPPGFSADSLPAMLAEKFDLKADDASLLAMVVMGRRNDEIAGVVSCPAGTVKSRLHRIYPKIGARNRAEAVLRCIVTLFLPAHLQGMLAPHR